MTKFWPGILALVAVALFGLLNLDRLPAEVATHWNLQGEADGWSGRLTAVLLLPGAGLVLAAIVLFCMGWGFWVFRAIGHLFNVICAMPGLEVNVQGPQQVVKVTVF